MKGIQAVALATFVASSTVSAISIAPRQPSPRVVGLDIQRRHITDPLSHDRARRAKRDQTVTETLDNEETLYFADITLGTPAQPLRMHIDTGSSDLWCNSANSTFCQQNTCIGGTYNAATSSSNKFVNGDFNISYVDGSFALGDYVSDTITIGGQSLKDFQFGVGYQSSSNEGVLGIGYTINEVQVNRAGDVAYPNLPQAMVDAGLIQSNAYSLWLNDLDASEGQILFGGIDTAKYTGSLQTLPIIQEYGQYREFIIALTGVSVNNGGTNKSISSSSLPAAVLLDSGSSLMYLPDSVASSIYDSVNAVYSSKESVAYVDCSLAGKDINLEFTFTNPTVSVPYNELVIESGRQFQDGSAACYFGIAPAGDSTAILGDTFLRSAYVVYDLANNEISLAQTNFNATSSDVREIGTGSNSVPDATGVSSAVTSVAVGSGGPRIGGPTSGSGTIVGATATATAGAMATQIPMLVAMGAAAGALAAAAM